MQVLQIRYSSTMSEVSDDFTDLEGAAEADGINDQVGIIFNILILLDF